MPVKVFMALNPYMYAAQTQGDFGIPKYRHILVTGTWTSASASDTGDLSKLTPPLVVELERGRKLAPITWVLGSHYFVCSNEITELLRSLGSACEFHEVRLVAGGLKRDGPTISQWTRMGFKWPIPTVIGRLDQRRHLAVSTSVSKNFQDLLGIDHTRPSDFCRRIYVSRPSVGDSGIFGIAELGGYSPLFCTEEWLRKLNVIQPENILFSEVGELV